MLPCFSQIAQVLSNDTAAMYWPTAENVQKKHVKNQPQKYNTDGHIAQCIPHGDHSTQRIVLCCASSNVVKQLHTLSSPSASPRWPQMRTTLSAPHEARYLPSLLQLTNQTISWPQSSSATSCSAMLPSFTAQKQQIHTHIVHAMQPLQQNVTLCGNYGKQCHSPCTCLLCLVPGRVLAERYEYLVRIASSNSME
jgi:hypothetical protein